MFASRSLGLRPLLRVSPKLSYNGAIVARNSTILRSTLSTLNTTENQEDKLLAAQRNNRPVSPHLQIYQPQVTWVLSGLHRFTGVVLAAGFYGITCSYAAGALFGFHFDASAVYQTIQDLPMLVKYAAKAAIAYPFAFHALNGLRHFTWDIGKELTIKGIYKTGYLVIAGTAILGTYLTFIS